MKNTIENAITKMLTENTGSHMLDSGGAYGRHWEKNQKRLFENEKKYTFDNYDISLNVYHYLVDNLTISKESQKYQRMYEKFVAKSEDYHLADMEDFIHNLNRKGLSQSDNYIIGKTPQTVNTYNHESLLSQVLQYIIFYDGDDYFILLQIHNGCDVRGGYTAPKIFEIEDVESFIMQNQSCSVMTKKGSYYTDDTYNFYNNNNESCTIDDLIKEGITGVSE